MPDLQPSGALILYTWQADRPQVLMVRRAENQRVFPGAWTFPGGSLDPDDIQAAQQTGLAPTACCALREVFEETGILPGFETDATPWRHQMLKNELTLSQFLGQTAYQPPSNFYALGSRVTPPGNLRRFQTDYWLLELTSPLAPSPELSPELASARWFDPADLIQAWSQGRILLPPPVRDVLEILQYGPFNSEQLTALNALSNDEHTLYRRREMHPGIEVLALRSPTLPPATHTNCYLLGDQRYLIIDPASPDADQQAQLADIIRERQAKGKQALEIVLTHHHTDHIGGVVALRQMFQIPVAAHPQTAELLASKNIPVDRLVNEGEIWDLGDDPYTDGPWQVEAWFTPGHAPGHLCLIDLRHRVAIVGDMLAGIGSILIAPPKGNMKQYLQGLQRLADGHLSLLFPAHGPLIHQPRERCLQYIEHRLMREQRILQALATGPSTLEGLMAQVYPEIQPDLEALAKLSLQAHLQKLLEEAQITEDSSNYRI